MKTIKEMDKEFAKEVGLTYNQYKALDLLEQSNIRRKITNKRMKNRK